MRANRRVQAHSDWHTHKLIELLLTPPGGSDYWSRYSCSMQILDWPLTLTYNADFQFFGKLWSWTIHSQKSRSIVVGSKDRQTDGFKKGRPYSITELIQAVSLQVTWVINPAVGCHYFPPGLQLPSQPLRGLLPVSLLGEQKHDGCEQFA